MCVGGLALAVEGPSKAEIKCVDNKDGTCNVTYFPQKIGQYEVTVKFADKHVPGSPFKANVVGKFIKVVLKALDTIDRIEYDVTRLKYLTYLCEIDPWPSPITKWLNDLGSISQRVRTRISS